MFEITHKVADFYEKYVFLQEETALHKKRSGWCRRSGRFCIQVQQQKGVTVNDLWPLWKGGVGFWAALVSGALCGGADHGHNGAPTTTASSPKPSIFQWPDPHTLISITLPPVCAQIETLLKICVYTLIPPTAAHDRALSSPQPLHHWSLAQHLTTCMME